MLTEAGFKPTVYWEQADEDGEGNGEFLPQTEVEADAGWIAYIVSQKYLASLIPLALLPRLTYNYLPLG